MRTECRVDRIEETRPISHADFLFRTAIYIVTRLADGQAFRVQLPRHAAWRAGDVVTIDASALDLASF